MKKELLALAASMALVSSLSASVKNHNNFTTSRDLSQNGLSLSAREAEPGDKKGKGNDGTGHKLTQEVAREAEPGDIRKGRGKDDPTGHKMTHEVAREAEPGDIRRGRGKDDPNGHKLTQEVAREAEPGDDRGRNRGRGRGKDDGAGHKLV